MKDIMENPFLALFFFVALLTIAVGFGYFIVKITGILDDKR